MTSESDFLAAYDPSAFPAVAVTVDIAVMTIRNGQLCILLIQRGAQPFQSSWALPGGFVKPDEDLDSAARRELSEETGLSTFPGHLEQLRSYGEPKRDPRMRVVSVAYIAMMPDLPTPVGGDDAAAARFWAIDDLPQLAFDHAGIINDAIERVRNKIEYSPLATSFVEEPFTLAELRRVYEAVWGTTLHVANFRRKVLSTPDFVVAEDALAPSGSEGGRPAELYRRGPARLLHPAMLRPSS